MEQDRCAVYSDRPPQTLNSTICNMKVRYDQTYPSISDRRISSPHASNPGHSLHEELGYLSKRYLACLELVHTSTPNTR
jgi:hypothetical protein